MYLFQAISLDEFNTDDLDLSEIDNMDLSDTLPGSFGAFMAYTQRLVSTAEEFLNFIESIFEIPGMENDDYIKKTVWYPQ